MNWSKLFIRLTKAFKGSLAAFILTLLSGHLAPLCAVAQRSGNASPAPKQLPVIWTFSAGGAITSSPLADNGIVYFGAEDSTWYALETVTGKIKWKLRTNAAIRSTAAISGDQIFLAGGNGVLASVNKTNGEVKWRIVFDQTALFMGERTYDFADYYHSSPVVENGVIYLATGNSVLGAYREDTGAMIWRYRAGDIVHSRPVIVRDKVIFGSFDGYVHAVNKNNGSLAWRFKTVGHQYFPKGEVQGGIATDGQRVFVGARDYNFYSIDANSGTALWNRKFDNGWAMSVTVADTVVYIGTSDDRLVVAADTRSGREYWHTDVKFNVFGNAAETSDQVIIGTIWGKAYGLDRNSGVVRWIFETQGFKANHLKYFTQKDSFRPDIGSILKTPYKWIAAERLMGGIFSTPAASGDIIILTSAEGKVYALKAN
ncbi:PQQ-binding-like beta-propeller repeat protein [Chryseolinea sp. T2]|uniref:outer membrane protein assembly factor BamB family protein n=1 Tax=Chryseolinea sp. T2 TaxID=3129255 RepID=UPI003077F7F7